MTEIPGIVQLGRRMQEDTMRDSCVVLDRIVVRDAGGSKETFVPRPISLQCRFGKVTDKEADQYAGVIENRKASTIMFPVGTFIEEGARVRNVATGTTWVVVADLNSESVYATIYRFLLREL